MFRLLVLFAFILLPSFSQSPIQRPKPAARAAKAAAHPDVGDNNCTGCHRDLNPDVVADYEASKHGRGLVGCAVCHGATTAGFVAKPDESRCVACHAAKVDSLKTPVMKGKNCWTCHVPHRLNPHAALWKNNPGAAK